MEISCVHICIYICFIVFYSNIQTSSLPLPRTGTLEATRSDLGGTHQPSNVKIEGSWPPAVSVYHGAPQNASPFVQCVLPQGWTFEHRRSKAVSYIGTEVYARGTSRSKEGAEQVAMACAWSWWNSLSQQDRSTLYDFEPAKKRRLGD